MCARDRADRDARGSRAPRPAAARGGCRRSPAATRWWSASPADGGAPRGSSSCGSSCACRTSSSRLRPHRGHHGRSARGTGGVPRRARRALRLPLGRRARLHRRPRPGRGDRHGPPAVSPDGLHGVPRPRRPCRLPRLLVLRPTDPGGAPPRHARHLAGDPPRLGASVERAGSTPTSSGTVSASRRAKAPAVASGSTRAAWPGAGRASPARGHVCASPDPGAFLLFDAPEVQQARRDALAWWIALLGDALVCLSTLTLDASHYGGAITVARSPRALRLRSVRAPVRGHGGGDGRLRARSAASRPGA